MVTKSVTPNTPVRDSQQIDRIIYLASLASVKSDIDPMLDTLRIITARRTAGEALGPNDVQSLQKLEQQLKTYIIHNDPLRAFDEETLERRLSRLSNQTSEHKLATGQSRWLVNVVELSIITALVPLVIPPYDSLGARLALFSTPLFFLVLACGTTLFYLTALTNFRHELRRAFLWLCLGIGILSLSFSHYALIQGFNLDRYPIFQYSGLTWFVTISFMCLYTGLCLYAKLLSIKTAFASWWGIAAIVGGIVLAILAPHSPRVDNELFFDFSLSGIVAVSVISLLAAGVAHAIARSVTSAYAKSMRLLYYYFAIGSVGSLGSAIALASLGQVYGPTLSVIIVLCGIAPQLLLLYTGYSFKKETSL